MQGDGSVGSLARFGWIGHALKVIHHTVQLNAPAYRRLVGYSATGVRTVGFNVVFIRVHIVVRRQADATGVDDGDEMAACWAGDADNVRNVGVAANDDAG